MSHRSDKLTGLTWHAIGLASALGLYFLESYFAFFEGCILAVYTASLWPHLSRRLVYYPPGKVLPVAILTWALMCIGSVWIVAYNFVPGGTVTRERTDVLIFVVVFLIALASRDRERGEEGRRREGKGGVREEGERERVTGGEREGLRQRAVGKLLPITEEQEEEEEEEEEEMDFEVDSTGSSVHEERALELLAAEEKECLRFRHRANRGTRKVKISTNCHCPSSKWLQLHVKEFSCTHNRVCRYYVFPNCFLFQLLLVFCCLLCWGLPIATTPSHPQDTQ